MSAIGQQTQVVALNRDYHSELRAWADGAVAALTSAIFLCDLRDDCISDSDFRLRKLGVKEDLSALIDRGRFFFPNNQPDVHGQVKPAAYRGFWPQVLDHLVHSYEVLRRIESRPVETNHSHRGDLWHLRKLFVSDLQQVLNPEEREAELKALMPG